MHPFLFKVFSALEIWLNVSFCFQDWSFTLHSWENHRQDSVLHREIWLKRVGINTLGRRLEVYEKVKQLISKGEEKASAKPGHYCSCTVCILKIRDDDNKNSKKFIKSESSTLLIIQLRNLWPCTIILQLCCMNMRHLFT